MKLKYVLGGALPFIKVTMMVSALEQSCTTDLESQKSICPESHFLECRVPFHRNTQKDVMFFIAYANKSERNNIKVRYLLSFTVQCRGIGPLYDAKQFRHSSSCALSALMLISFSSTYSQQRAPYLSVQEQSELESSI